MPEKHSPFRSLLEWAGVLVIALIIALFIRTFVICPFQVPSGSMEHTIEIGDHLLAQKVTVNLGQGVSRGDVVVFENVDGESDHEFLVKRVIATEGQTVDLEFGSVYVDGERLDEDYTVGSSYPLDDISDIDLPYTVPKGHIWVMGDNREQSLDSRAFGAVPMDNVVGVGFLRYWPLNRLGPL